MPVWHASVCSASPHAKWNEHPKVQKRKGCLMANCVTNSTNFLKPWMTWHVLRSWNFGKELWKSLFSHIFGGSKISVVPKSRVHGKSCTRITCLWPQTIAALYHIKCQANQWKKQNTLSTGGACSESFDYRSDRPPTPVEVPLPWIPGKRNPFWLAICWWWNSGCYNFVLLFLLNPQLDPRTLENIFACFPCNTNM